MPNLTSLNQAKLRYVICPGSLPDLNFQSTYKAIYDCWFSVWKDAYREMKVESELYSDSFTRQNYIGALFLEEKCLGLCFFRWANYNLPDFSHDSYFSYWNSEDLVSLTKCGSNIIVSSNFTIAFEARKGILGLPIKDLLTGISVEFFMNANADAMAANLRVDKKVNEACKKWGAELIRPNVHFSGGICGDLMVFYKDQVLKRPKLELETTVQNLWSNRTIIPKIQKSEENYFLQNDQEKAA